jgi:hypothetical protein
MDELKVPYYNHEITGEEWKELLKENCKYYKSISFD